MTSSALRNITEPTPPKHFSTFKVAEMQTIDRASDELFKMIDTLYRSKNQEEDVLRKSSSLILERDKKQRTKSTFENYLGKSSNINEVIALKLDLTYPKTINSKIVNEASAINKILERKVKKYTLIYRASESAFSISNFY